jgi:hypothetical protein
LRRYSERFLLGKSWMKSSCCSQVNNVLVAFTTVITLSLSRKKIPFKSQIKNWNELV